MKRIQNEKSFYKIIEYFDCPVIWLSPKEEVLEINKHALTLYGWKKPAVIGKNFSNLLNRDNYENPLPKRFSSKTNKTSIKKTQNIIKKSKKLILQWKINPIFNRNTLHSILVIGNDLTKQKKVEDKIYELDSIIGQMPGNVYWYDKNDNYLGCNENSAKTLGLTRKKAVGKNFRALMKTVKGISEDAINQWIQDGVDVMQSKIPKLNIEEAPFIGPNNKMVYMVSNKVPLFNKKGQLYGVLGISTDITIRKEVEEDLRKAKEQAEAANKAKTDFLANMSHDVKTPLSGIIAISELLKARVSDEYRDLVLDIMQAGRSLMNFFENCIELSKLESGIIPLLEEVFSLKQLLNEILRLFQPAIKSKGLGIEVEFSSKIPKYFFGNRIYLYRILLNLMGNAIKFTPQGTISVRVDLDKKSTAKKSIIVLSIADTGIGIAKDKQTIIFDQFSRVTPSYEGIYEGSGIGLYIVQKFVRHMDGKIEVESKEDEGSTFTVTLPLQVVNLANKQDEEDIVFPHQGSMPINSSSAIFRSKQDNLSTYYYKILLVEDNFLAQKSTSLLLNSLNCHVDIADCGKKAISMFQPGKYNLVFMDIGLPDIKGYEVATRFRELEKETHFHTPILGLSAHITKEEKQLGAKADMDGVLSKPLLFDDAIKLLKEYIPNFNYKK